MSPVLLSYDRIGQPPLNNNIFRVVVIGDTNVGKTSLMNRIQIGEWMPFIRNTIGGAYIVLPRRTRRGDTVSFWDTSGSDRFTYMLPNYLRGADLVLLCFKIGGDTSSIDYLHRIWSDESIRQGENHNVLVVATQSDTASAEEQETSRRVAVERLGFSMIHVTSSVSGAGIDDLVAAIYTSIEGLETPAATPLSSRVSIDVERRRRKCCIIQ